MQKQLLLRSRADRVLPPSGPTTRPPLHARGFFMPAPQHHPHLQRTRHEQPGHGRHRSPQTTERATYDIAATETKWQRVWERARPVPRRRRQPAREALRADDVPLPERRPAHGSRRGVRAARRGGALLVAARLRGAEPDGLRLLRPARGERGDPPRRAPRHLHPRQHRQVDRVVPQVRRVLRLVAHVQHQRPGVLPLDAVAVPGVLQAGPGLPQEQPGQLVPQRPDRAGQRAGRRRRLRPLRRGGDQEGADPVVLQDHRLRPGAAGRPGRAGGHLARPRGHRAAQLDRPLRGRPRRLRHHTAGGERAVDGLHHPSRHAVRRDVHGGGGRRRAGRGDRAPTTSARRWTTTWSRSARPPRSTGWRPTGPRPASTWASTRPTR